MTEASGFAAAASLRTDLDDLVVGNIRDKTLDEISGSDESWNIIKGFYSGKRPETCLECTFYRPIDQQWMQERSRKNGAPVNDQAVSVNT